MHELKKKLQFKHPIKQQDALSPTVKKPWKLLIVDDDAEIHLVTKMALENLRFQDRPLQLISVHSAAEAKPILAAENDFAVVLLDVVMETPDAGLRLVEYIRNDCLYRNTRIILRTGHPGEVPEESVIQQYEIDDYKEKNELTARKLTTTIIAALRTYDTLCALQISERGLSLILDSSEILFEFTSAQNFAEGVVRQLSQFLTAIPAGFMCIDPLGDKGVKLGHEYQDLRIIGSSGHLTLFSPREIESSPEKGKAFELAKKAIAKKQSLLEDNHLVLFLNTKITPGAVVLAGVGQLSDDDRFLLSIFTSKVSLALANVIHYDKMIRAQRAASIDFLTQLPNRREFITIGKELVHKCHELGFPITLAMLDIDHFKRVNDTYGHDSGDELLRQLSALFQSKLRKSDLIARIGGEEFCLLLPNTPIEGSRSMLARLCHEVEAHLFHLGKESLHITISIGADTYPDDLDHMTSRADKNLYIAKESGRNRLVMPE